MLRANSWSVDRSGSMAVTAIDEPASRRAPSVGVGSVWSGWNDPTSTPWSANEDRAATGTAPERCMAAAAAFLAIGAIRPATVSIAPSRTAMMTRSTGGIGSPMPRGMASKRRATAMACSAFRATTAAMSCPAPFAAMATAWPARPGPARAIRIWLRSSRYRSCPASGPVYANVLRPDRLGVSKSDVEPIEDLARNCPRCRADCRSIRHPGVGPHLVEGFEHETTMPNLRVRNGESRDVDRPSAEEQKVEIERPWTPPHVPNTSAGSLDEEELSQQPDRRPSRLDQHDGVEVRALVGAPDRCRLVHR